jgi:glycosyltransferase involved in cell wall biosynthesis
VLHDLIFRKPLLSLNQFQSRRQLAGALYRRIVAPMAVKAAAEIVTVSETSRLEICAAYDIPPERITVIPNTLPDFWFQDNLTPHPQLSAGRPYILAVSGAALSKNLYRLIQAFSSAQQSGEVRGVNLLIVGLVQHEQARFKQLAEDLGVGNRVVLCPRVSDQELKSLYSKSSLFVFPSTDEGFGIPLLEAMAVGVPVICSSIPVFHEIGLDHVGYFDPFSTDDLAKSLAYAFSRKLDVSALYSATDHARTYSFNIKQAEITELFKTIILKHVP